MKKVIFAGCSFTAGNGWDCSVDPEKSMPIECKDDPKLWVNLCHNQILKLKELKLVNAGIGGASNTEIFQATVKELSGSHEDIDTIFCQWTSMPRYRFDIGFELYPTNESIRYVRKSSPDVRLSNGTRWSRGYLIDLYNRLLVLHHLHPEIVKVVEYSNILKRLCKKFDIKLYFINGICPWDQNYFVRLHNVLPEAYTPFTKDQILEIKFKNDDDIFKLYEILHNDYDKSGRIDPADWINLYGSMEENKIDTNHDNYHPGIKSNQLYFEQVKNFLENQ
jgi:hypothetical protein